MDKPKIATVAADTWEELDKRLTEAASQPGVVAIIARAPLVVTPVALPVQECGGKVVFHPDAYGGWWECETCHGRYLRCLEPVDQAHCCTKRVYHPATEAFDGPRIERSGLLDLVPHPGDV